MEFQVERDKTAQRLAELQARLNSRDTQPAEFATLPGEIAATAQALEVLDRRLIQADIDELDQQMQAIEAERANWRAVMRETEAAALKTGELSNRLANLLMENRLDDKTKANLETFLNMAAETLPAVIRNRHAGDEDRGCIMRINALREKRAGLVRQQQRNGAKA